MEIETFRRDGQQGIPSQIGSGGGPESPLDLTAPDWKATIRRTLSEITDDRAALAAAGMAFYWFLAIFPALIAAVGLLDLLNASPQVISSINRSIQSTLPGGAGRILTTAVANAQESSEKASLTAAIVGIAFALWSASSGMVALQGGLAIAYDVKKDRKFIKKRLVAFALVLAVGVLGGVPSPFFAGDSTILSVIGWIVTLIAVTVMFAIFYYLGPNRDKPKWQWVSAGGVVGAVIWIAVSLGFSFYVSSFGKYGETYGPLAGVVVLIFWLYLSAMAVMIGAELNAELERQSAMKQG